MAAYVESLTIDDCIREGEEEVLIYCLYNKLDRLYTIKGYN